MTRYLRLSTNVSAPILLLLFVTAAHAATLKEIERRAWRNGDPVIAAEAGSGEATGNASIQQSNQFLVDADTNPSTGTQQNDAEAIFEILPEAEEEVGDPVCVRYSFMADGSVSVSSTELAAAVVGTGGPASDAMWDAGPPPSATVAFGTPARITVNPLGSAVVVFEQAPVTRNNNGTYSIERSGVFPAVIGDFIQLSSANATAWAVLPVASAEGENETLLTAEVIDGLCAPPQAVPASSPVGLAILVIVLLAVGWFGWLRLG